MMTRVYIAVGALALLGYLSVSARGMIFSGTDGRPSFADRSRAAGRRPGGGGFFWGVGGYRGGK